VGRVLGDPECRKRVEKLLDEAKALAHELLGSNRHLVIALRDALLAREELVGSEITDVLEIAAAARPTVVDLTVVDLTDGESSDMWVQDGLA
jgi:cell division protease FtsH